VSAPALGVSAIVVEGARVLVVRRLEGPARGQWAFPGGRLEFGESLAAGARREVREECGLAVEIGPLVDVVELIVGEPEPAHWVVLGWLARARGGVLRPADDAAEARWVTLDVLAALDTPAGIVPMAARALAMAPAW